MSFNWGRSQVCSKAFFLLQLLIGLWIELKSTYKAHTVLFLQTGLFVCGSASVPRLFLLFRIHPRDKQDVAYRLTLGARAVAYNEKGVPFQGPFPNQILSTQIYVNVTYDQEVSVTPSKDMFEVCL